MGGGVMGFWTEEQIEDVNRIAAKSKSLTSNTTKIKTSTKTSSITSDLAEMSENVIKYFHDSEAILITSKQELHDYVTKVIQSGYAGIDTETTGLDRIKDTIVGASLYYPGGVECYIPMKHLIPIFDEPYKGQLSYSEVGEELQRLADAKVKLIFANADFDLAMIYKDLKVDLCPVCYYDVLLAWRCLKENEKDNSLKGLYNKYVLRGQGNPMKFSDFFTPAMFPYCKPDVAKLYAANDAKITYELFKWQLPYVTKDHPKCKKAHLEKIADLVWAVEFPLISICQQMHRTGMYLDQYTASVLMPRYKNRRNAEMAELAKLVDEILSTATLPRYGKKPFTKGEDFNPNSPIHVTYLLYNVMKLPKTEGEGTGKDVLAEFNLPVTNQILKVRSTDTLIGTFVDKLPKATTDDSRIHAQFKQIGADCIVGDSILPTPNGYLRIGDICKSHNCMEAEHVDVNDVTIINKDQVIESVASVIQYTDYPTIKITTELGFELEGTHNHPIMVSKYTESDRIHKDSAELSDFWEGRYFKRLDEISVGDYVEIPCNYSDKIIATCQKTNLTLSSYTREFAFANEYRVPEFYDADFALWLGMYHADGSTKLQDGTYRIIMSNDDPDVISEVDRLSKKLFNLHSHYYPHSGDRNGGDSIVNCLRLSCLDTILSHKKQSKKIPEAIFKSPVYVINSYIRGMTLDSTVYKDLSGRVHFELSICNIEDARFVQMHLASQGILCSRRWNHNNYGKSPRMKFNADNYARFRDIIGFVESKKYMDTEGSGALSYETRRIGNSFRVKVRSIEYSKNTVYDLHIPGTHSFISNGFISHNTGRLSSAEPNVMNIPSHAADIRHMFRATPGYVMLSSDYSRQEPAITAYVSGDKSMLDSFINNRDIYASIASLAFNMPYEKCLEFHPETHEYQPDGKARRGEAKTILLGISYGRAIPSIAEQLYGTRDDMTDEEKIKGAQHVYDSVMQAFPGLRRLMTASQKFVKQYGYTETILGRRRHIPDMQLPEYDFKPLQGYVNPDIDPLDPSTLQNKSDIPDRVKEALRKELSSYKYFGQVAKRMRQLHDEKHIQVINNRKKLNDASRKVCNSIIQGSAADMSKLAIINLCNDPEWNRIGGRLLTPIHDELCCEVPIEYWKEGGEILSRCMLDAASFLPFSMKCDVTTTLRWYGLEYPCKYPKPNSLQNLSEDEVKWIQYQLYELEYTLPVFKGENGEKPRGDAALGVNGIVSDAYNSAIQDYKNKYNISSDEQFIEDIERRVVHGI